MIVIALKLKENYPTIKTSISHPENQKNHYRKIVTYPAFLGSPVP